MKALEQYLQDAQSPDDLRRLLLQIASICAEISSQIRLGALAGIHGDAGTGNVQGEQQKKLDVIANDLFLQNLSKSGVLDISTIVPDPGPELKRLLWFQGPKFGAIGPSQRRRGCFR